MKKLLLILLCVPLIGLGQTKEEDKYNLRSLESIKVPCDCLDHSTELMKIAISKMNSDKNYNPDNDIILEKHVDKIIEYCEDKFGREIFPIAERELRNCDYFDEAKEIFQEIMETAKEEIIESTDKIITEDNTEDNTEALAVKKTEYSKEEIIEVSKNFSTPISNKALYHGKKKTTITFEGRNSDADLVDLGIGENEVWCQLGGRKPTFKPSPQGNQIEGRVVVVIIVDRLGNVINAFPGSKGSTTLNKELCQSAKKAALETKFEPKLSAPINQQGKITYTYQFIRKSN